MVFTGDMELPREVWTARAEMAGLVAHPSVTKRVALVVAADPGSLSTRARKAADHGIPIVGEQAFDRILGQLSRACGVSSRVPMSRPRRCPRRGGNGVPLRRAGWR